MSRAPPLAAITSVSLGFQKFCPTDVMTTAHYSHIVVHIPIPHLDRNQLQHPTLITQDLYTPIIYQSSRFGTTALASEPTFAQRLQSARFFRYPDLTSPHAGYILFNYNATMIIGAGAKSHIPSPNFPCPRIVDSEQQYSLHHARSRRQSHRPLNVYPRASAISRAASATPKGDIRDAKSLCPRDHLSLTGDEISLLKVHRSISILRYTLLQISDVHWSTKGFKNYRHLCRKFYQCKQEVKRIQVAVQLVVEAERQHKYIGNIRETEAIVAAAVRDPRGTISHSYRSPLIDACISTSPTVELKSRVEMCSAFGPIKKWRISGVCEPVLTARVQTTALALALTPAKFSRLRGSDPRLLDLQWPHEDGLLSPRAENYTYRAGRKQLSAEAEHQGLAGH
ncbi:hypothetical protein C8R44DRAFT_723544 [Mycena epipterygia]|nr:hypothetical protein C8R44DRAFT_723544 [Mycena epipterygia]